MTFNYDSIFGLQYTSPEEYIILDLCNIPKDMDLEEALKLVKESYMEFGIPFFDAKIIEDKQIRTNYER